MEEGVTLYGRLIELKDKTQIEREGGQFWGELRRDNGERWRVQFEGAAESVVVPLFRQQVAVSGSAYYFQTRAPKLIASAVAPDEKRDYLAAFDAMRGIHRAVDGPDFDGLLAARYGED